MSRYQNMFQNLKLKNQAAFIPFVTLGDPDIKTSKNIITTLIESGADALELGIAFSDPLADGPIIQKAGLRALKSGSTVKSSLDLIKEIREISDIPIGILTYANLVVRRSTDWFYGLCNESGVDSVLVADVPIFEAELFSKSALKHKIDPILIAPINLPLEHCSDIARLSRGYTYVVTRKGVTGADKDLNLSHKKLIKALHEAQAAPPVFGFGISSPEHVKASIKEGAQGVISGSQVVGIIENNLGQASLYSELSRFVKTMKEATIIS
jgi:tryptophan synthase alpha chain